MNQFPDLGSLWKGRILLSAVVYEEEKPKLGSENIDQKILQQHTSKSMTKEWTIIAEVLFGEGYPEKKEKYSIEVRWANQEIHFSSVSATHCWEWYERKKMVCGFPYANKDGVELIIMLVISWFLQLPDVFVYLKEGSKRIAFFRKKAKDIFNNLEQEPALCFFQISKDKYPDLRDDQAGYVKMRVSIGPKETYQNISVGGWNNPLLKPDFSESMLFIHVYNVIINFFVNKKPNNL